MSDFPENWTSEQKRKFKHAQAVDAEEQGDQSAEARRWIAKHLHEINPEKDFDAEGNLIAPAFLAATPDKPSASDEEIARKHAEVFRHKWLSGLTPHAVEQLTREIESAIQAARNV